MTTEAEAAVMGPQPKDPWNPRSWKRQGLILVRRLVRSTALPTP